MSAAEAETEADAEAAFAAELEALSDIEPVVADGGIVLLVPDLCTHIQSFLPTTELQRLGRVCRQFHSSARLLARNASAQLLRDAGLTRGRVALQVEDAIFEAVGRRDVTRYFERLRLSIANLRQNEDLRARVDSGVLAPAAFARMDTADMMRPETAAERERMRQKAIEAARRPQPSGDVRDVFACAACGCVRQWVRRHGRHGLVDKFSETLVCVDCLAVVLPLSSRIVTSSSARASGPSAKAAGDDQPDAKRVRA